MGNTKPKTFKTRTGKFKKGYYFIDVWSRHSPFYRFYLSRTAANAKRINNSSFVLEYFEALPDGAIVNID